MDDRQVHASHPDGREVVRYNRAGKWYIERPAWPRYRRRHVDVGEAVRLARLIYAQGGIWYEGQPGGKVFDRRMHQG